MYLYPKTRLSRRYYVKKSKIPTSYIFSWSLGHGNVTV